MADIFLHVNGAQHGPYSEEQLRGWLRDGTVSPESLAWKEGMAGWQPVTAVVPGAVVAPRPVAPHRTVQPYRQQAVATPTYTVLRGFNRMKYVVVNILVNLLLWGGYALILGMVAGAASAQSASSETVDMMNASLGIGYLVVLLLTVIIGFWLVVKRLQNIGWSGAWMLLMFVPVANLILSALLLILPPNYSNTKKLDGASWAWIIFLLLLTVLVGIGGYLVATKFDEAGGWEMIEKLRK